MKTQDYERLCRFIIHAWYLEDEYSPHVSCGPDEFEFGGRHLRDFIRDDASPYARPRIDEMVSRVKKAMLEYETESINREKIRKMLGIRDKKATEEGYTRQKVKTCKGVE